MLHPRQSLWRRGREKMMGIVQIFRVLYATRLGMWARFTCVDEQVLQVRNGVVSSCIIIIICPKQIISSEFQNVEAYSRKKEDC